MSTQHAITVAASLLLLSACATAPVRPAFSEFQDIPVVEGMNYDPGRSTVIESPTIKAARFVYRGRIEVESLSASTRKGLEANGWRHVGTTTTSKGSILEVFEKTGSTVQLVYWEGFWYTYLEVAATRLNQARAQR